MHSTELDFGAALVAQTQAFAELVSVCDLSAPVPTTPAWSLGQLTEHLGHGHKWASQMVARRSDVPLHWMGVPGTSPEDYAPQTLMCWLPGTARALVDAVKEQGANTLVWTMLGSKPAAWWLRRRLHEATIHRADASLALGVQYHLQPELAADGISDLLDLVIVQAGREVPGFNGPEMHPLPLDEGQALQLQSTDAGQITWTVVRDGEGLKLGGEYADNAMVLRGPSADLLLTLTRRRSVEDTRVEMSGDPTVLRNWLDTTPY